MVREVVALTFYLPTLCGSAGLFTLVHRSEVSIFELSQILFLLFLRLRGQVQGSLLPAGVQLRLLRAAILPDHVLPDLHQRWRSAIYAGHVSSQRMMGQHRECAWARLGGMTLGHKLHGRSASLFIYVPGG